MKKDQELIAIAKTYDLILWSCNHTSQFPRNHRFVPGERIERNLYGLRKTLIAAKNTKSRQRLLEEANLSLEVLCSARVRSRQCQGFPRNSPGSRPGSASSSSRDQSGPLPRVRVKYP